MITIYDDIPQGSDEWLALRCGILTASEISKILTAKTLKSAANDHSRALVMEKAAQRITGEIEPQFISDDMLRGIEQEPVARDYYRQVEPDAREVGFVSLDMGGFVIGCSPDALVGDNGGWECKCPRQKEHVRTVIAGEVPEQYALQVQTSLLVTGRDWWDYSSFFGGLDMPIIRVEPDLKIHAAIRDAAEQFEETVQAAVKAWGERGARGIRMVPTEKVIEQEVYLG